MTRWKTVILCFLGWILVFCPVTVKAEDSENWLTPQQQESLWEASGAQGLTELLPQDAQNILEKSGLEDMDTDEILQIDPKGFLSGVWNSIWDSLTAPLKMFGVLTGVVLLAALMKNLSQGLGDKSVSGIYQLISVLCVSGMIVTPLLEAIRQTTARIEQVNDFLLGFIPVYTGIISVSGKPLSAFTYHSLLLGAVEIMGTGVQTILVPLIGVYLAVCLTGAVSGGMPMGGVAKTVKTAATWILGLLMTLFVGLLTIKGILAGAADSVTLRAGKYLAGAFIPLIGNAVGDALTVVQGSVGVIRSTIGVVGILGVTACFLPSILQLGLLGLAVRGAQGVGELLETSEVSSVLDAAGFVVSFLQTVMILYALMVLISISLMLVLGGG
ncbi:MAG: stage III sporulation protein AE [Massiliimalia sp.]